jgi:hypothetical protein
MNEETFKVRAYGYGELAQLYFPQITKQSATVQFRRWICKNIELQNQLTSVGFIPGQKILTPKQVKIVVDILGEP